MRFTRYNAITFAIVSEQLGVSRYYCRRRTVQVKLPELASEV